MSRDSKNIPPYSEEAERAILGAVLLDNAIIPQIEALPLEAFFLQSNRDIVAAIRELHAAAAPVDLATLATRLSDLGKLDTVGGASYISRLTDGIPKSANVKHYVKILREKLEARQAIEAGQALTEAGWSGDSAAVKEAKKKRGGKEKNNGHKKPPADEDDEWEEFWQESDGLHTRLYTKDGTPQNVWVCAPLEVAAVTCDENGDGWGRLLKWKDLDEREHSWAMPMQLLAGSGEDLRKSLYNGGLKISPQKTARDKLLKYIQAENPEQRGISVTKVGWHGDVFVLPDANIGNVNGQLYFYQPPQEAWHNIRVAGTVEEWTAYVGTMCSGNSRLILAVAAAFAAPLLSLTDSESGGFHFYGDSSKGKSTAQTVGGSVWGGGAEKGYLESWRTTANGLEIFAEIHNDGLGCLDEIGQIEARQLGEAVYMLANGQGKGRMSKNIGSRKRLSWQMLFLSSGNVTLSQHMGEAGQAVNTALEIRLISITADAGARMGMFEDIHGKPDSKSFAEYLTAAAYKIYGSPIREFLKLLSKDRLKIAGKVRERMDMFARDSISAAAPSEIRRAGRRFGLCVAAGELATEWGLTGWKMEEVAPLVKKCLNEWINYREPGDSDRGVDAVKKFLEMHGASRFQDIKGTESQHVINRAGFRRTSTKIEGIEYLIFPEVFRSEVCRGFDWRAVANLLKDTGHLIPASDGILTQSVYVPGGGQHRFFCLQSSVLG